MSFSASELLADLPRLRRYARILTDDLARANDVVEYSVALARITQDVAPFGTTRHVQLFALLRSAYFDTISSSRQCGNPPPADAREPA